MEKRNKILRFVSYGLEILIFFILQGVPNLIPEVLGGRPVLLISLALTIACFEDEIPAMAFGIACGAMLDFGVGTSIGFYTITLAVVCYFIGYITDYFFNTKFLSALIIGFVLIPAILSLNFLITYVFKGYDYIGFYYLHHTLATIGYTFVTLPVFYGINRCLSRGFSHSTYL